MFPGLFPNLRNTSEYLEDGPLECKRFYHSIKTHKATKMNNVPIWFFIYVNQTDLLSSCLSHHSSHLWRYRRRRIALFTLFYSPAGLFPFNLSAAQGKSWVEWQNSLDHSWNKTLSTQTIFKGQPEGNHRWQNIQVFIALEGGPRVPKSWSQETKSFQVMF